ncbi:MAG: branched-chain amino acid ABC transporter ATP-binding protein/permease [Deinococcales bacterium]
MRNYLSFEGLSWLVFVLFVIIVPLFLSSFYLRLMSLIGLYSLVVMGLVLLTGYAGLASLGQAAFMGVGAYTAAILSSRFALNPWLSMIAGILLAVLIAWLIGLITLRLKGHFLALATLAWGLVITGILRNWISVTGGNTGFGSATGNRFPPLSILGYPLRDERLYTYLIWFFVLLVLFLSLNLMRSRMGLAIKALRTGSIAAASFGVNVSQLKMLTFLLAAAFAALAGALFAFKELFIDPKIADLSTSINLLIMAVMGGIGSLTGAIFGPGLFVFLESFLQEYLPWLIGRSGNYEIIAFGFILIFILHRARQGLLPLLRDLLPASPVKPINHQAEPLPKRILDRAEGEVLLRVDDVSKNFGGLRAVDSLSFEVKRGEILGLIGPNGAGKSTMFNLITGVLRLSEGEISFKDSLISKLAPHQIAQRGIARTFQHLNLIGNMSLLDNVVLGGYGRTKANVWQGMLGLEGGERERARAEAHRQLKRVGLAEQSFERADSLALGKQRLVEIARALMADPELILLDEPAAGLRKHEKAELIDLIRKLKAEGITVLLVEHDMELVMTLCERIVVVNYGTKLAEGSPKAIKQNPKVLEAYLGSESASL